MLIIDILWVILMVVFVIMIGVLWSHEGWKRALKVIGFWLSSVIISVVITEVFGFSIAWNRVFGLSLWIFWGMGLVFYNIKKGHFKRNK